MKELLPHHRAMLDASGISEEVLEVRGAWSATSKAELRSLGFTAMQQNVPALVFPLYDVRGEIAGYQVRPDRPRIGRDQKPVKYDTPQKQTNVIDLNPLARKWLNDPAVPLLITEGVKKADSALSRGACCLALLGVWNWRHTNDHAGRTALPEWEYIALNAGRVVYVIFDSDVMTKPHVHRALARFKEFLEGRGAEVWIVYLPAGEGGAKVGLDDFLASGGSIEDLRGMAVRELKPLPNDSHDPVIPYQETPHGIVYVTETDNGISQRPLTNFCARILADIASDDGEECSHEFEIEASHQGFSTRFTAPVREFLQMQWPTERLGAKAYIYPPQTNREYAKVAIQALSDPITMTRYAHTGWREVDGSMVYLHAGGGIGANGPVDGVNVSLHRGLDRYRLPDPPAEEKLREAVRRSLDFLKIATLEQTWPLLGAVYGAPLAELIQADFLVWVYGSTQQRKSSVVALALCHYGRFDRNSLPASFIDTGNSLEVFSFLAKDALLVIDNFAPAADPRTAAMQLGAFQRLILATGDRRGRGRLTADVKLRGGKAPRALMVATAEDRPPGSQSSEARTFPVEWAPNSVNLETLTLAQEQHAKLYPLALAGYVAWLAPQYSQLRELLPQRVREVSRKMATEFGRTSDNGAKLLAGVSLFLRYAEAVGAISETERAEHWREARLAIMTSVRRADRDQSDKRPTVLFREYLNSCFLQKRVFLVDRHTGEAPKDEPARWGYVVKDDDDKVQAWPRESASLVGWLCTEEGLVYLEPTLVYQAVVDFARRSDLRFPITRSGLATALNHEGLLAKKGADRLPADVRVFGKVNKERGWAIEIENLDPEATVAPVSPNDGPFSPHCPQSAAEVGTPAEAQPTHENGRNGQLVPTVPVVPSPRNTRATPVGVCVHAEPDEDTATHTPHTREKTTGDSGDSGDKPSNCQNSVRKSNGSHYNSCPRPVIENGDRYLGSGDRGTLPVTDTLHITTSSDLTALIESLTPAPVVGLDVETYAPKLRAGTKAAKEVALNPRKGEIRLLSLATERGTWLVDCQRVDPSRLMPLLSTKELVAHNASFDFRYLARYGLEVRSGDCTMNLSRVLYNGMGPRLGHSLAAAAERELGVPLPKELQKADWSGLLTSEMLEYAARDAAVLLPLRAKLYGRLKAEGLATTAEIERRCLPAVLWMALSGVPLDVPAWEALSDEADAKARELEAQLNAAAPPPPGLDLGQGWKWTNPDIVLRVFREVGVDLPDTRDETLSAVEHPLGELLRQFRAQMKLSGSYGRNWLEFTDTGRLYPQWKQVWPESGRMACEDPNAQQVPRDPRYRRCIAAPPGRVLVKADYSQIELRVAAKITRDRRMLEAYAAGEDLHTATARILLGREFKDAAEKKAARQMSKAVNFGLLFGMSAETLQLYAWVNFGVRLSLEEAESYRATFFRTYSGLRKWHRSQKDGPVDVRTISGRRRLQVERYTEKLNTPVQGSAADGLKRALALLFERRADCPDAFPVIAAHDEIVVECDEANASLAAGWLEAAMVDGMSDLIDPVPVVVEVQIGRTWAG